MTPPKKLRILFAGGGTGGHLFPGLAIAEAFNEQRECDIRFVGTRHGIEWRVIPEKGLILYTIPISGLYRVGLIKTVKSLIKFPLAFLKSAWILTSFRPHLVVGIGGYASGPLMAVAILLRKRTIIQEQNAYPGITNRILGKLVPLTFVPFRGLESIFRNPVVVGNPIRKSILSASSKPDPRKPDEFVITILGGSQGARILNRTVTAMLPQLNTLKNRVKIVHHTGKFDRQWVQEAYQNHPELRAEVSSFFINMERVYLESSLIVCRSGSIVNEIVAMGRASVLVPIAVSSGNHQLENAKTMKNAGAAILIEEKDLTPDLLWSTIQDLLANREKLVTMEYNSRSLFPGDSAAQIAQKTVEHFDL